MPKNRQNGTIAGRSTNADQDEREMSDRLQERIRQLGPITVEVESRTRRRRENVEVGFDDLNHASVTTDGGIYHVDIGEGTCTCPDHVHRQGRCRHIEAVDIAREQTRQGMIAGSTTDSEISTNQLLSERQNAETTSEIHNVNRVYVDDDFFYTENTEAFENDLERLRNEPVPYYYDNILNGSDITFGIELEFVNGDSNAIAAELHSLGICGNRSMIEYHGDRTPGKWTLESDSSVTSGRRGGELISPILTDTPETWRTIEKVCEVAKRHGARVNTKTGGHVHVGISNALDGKRQRWRRFFKMGVGFEKVYERISGGEQGMFRGGYYAPSSETQNRRGISMRLPEEGATNEYLSRIGSIGRKYQMTNVYSLPTKGTIEFRGFNGTLTPGVIQANVKYAAGVINSAERSRIQGAEAITPTASDRKRGRIINEYNINNQRSNDAIMRTLDTVFSRREDKEHLLSVIAKNSWYPY